MHEFCLIHNLNRLLKGLYISHEEPLDEWQLHSILLFRDPVLHLGCSSRMWTEIWDDVRNPLSDVISDSVFRRSNSVFASQKTLRELYLAKTESKMTSLRGFLTSSQISVHILLLHPKCSTGSRKSNITEETKYVLKITNIVCIINIRLGLVMDSIFSQVRTRQQIIFCQILLIYQHKF